MSSWSSCGEANSKPAAFYRRGRRPRFDATVEAELVFPQIFIKVVNNGDFFFTRHLTGEHLSTPQQLNLKII